MRLLIQGSIVGVCLIVFWSMAAFAAYDETSRTVDSAGMVSGNASYQTVNAAGQGCPVGLTSNSRYLNYSGFLGTFVLQPSADIDGDNVIDENDPDDDGDGLWDSDELLGSSFSPSTATSTSLADTDGDGINDGSEAVAGTNPTDADSLLIMSGVRRVANNNQVVSWQARADFDYEVLRASTVSDLSTNSTVIGAITATNGFGAWQETTASITVTNSATRSFYVIRVVP